jgi:uncharacterized protein (TIGR02996 family)
MTDGQALLQAILASPDDDLPRLAYADWLDETGGPEAGARAEFIRLQCRLEAASLSEGQAGALWPRVKGLLREHDRAWRAELPALPGVSFRRFRRGLVDEARFRTWQRFEEHVPGVFAAVPLVRALIPAPYFAPALGASPYLERLRELDLSGGGASPRTALEVAECPRLRHLRRLTLTARSGERFRDSQRVIHIWAARALAASPHLANLRREPQVTPAARSLLRDRFGDGLQL